MSNFSSDIILLSGQLLTATGNQLYANGSLVGSSNFDLYNDTTNTGAILYNDITSLSGVFNSTAITISGLITGVSGYLKNISQNKIKRFSFYNGFNTITALTGPNEIVLFGGLGYISNIFIPDISIYTGVRLICNIITSGSGVVYAKCSGRLDLASFSLASFADTYNSTLPLNVANHTILTSGFLPIAPSVYSGISGVYFDVYCSGISSPAAVIGMTTIDFM
jgi:hypothetical protein